MGDSTDSDSTETTTEERVTITLTDYPVPVAEDDRETGLEALEDAISQLLDVNIAPADITARVGHHYVQIGDDCPRCGGTLELREYTYCDNGAVAEANCAHAPDCEWRGRAIYRMIDLESGPVTDVESTVANGDMTPSYYSY
ncbi:hypothetical protein MUK72_15485 (plasmid) [Halococcus dombrowskii]|nr:hypothetical protein [Halococcus dombrowskii]UOO96597.1 hypothetical protein MUK72_15485 [Halococcus dombrowskii]